MRQAIHAGIALLPLIIGNYETSVSALVVRMPLHMTKGDKSAPNSNGRIPSTSSVLASTAPSPLEPPTDTKNKKVRRKSRFKSKSKAPLVDSTLLRFLSAQKSQLKQTEDTIVQPGADATPGIETEIGIEIQKVITDPNADADADETINTDERRNSNTNTNIDNKGEKDGLNLNAKSKASKTIVQDTTADVLSWFTQYNAHRIALKLKSLGASDESAKEAGNAVQKYSLARTTRQRIRKFLRDRDLKWTSGSTGTGMEEPAAAVSDLRVEAEMRGRIYDVDAVVALLVDEGLTGRDIAAIFTHTPSISMMKARRGDAEKGGETLEDTLNRSFSGVLCSTIKLRKYDARKVLRTCPGLLTKRGSISAREVVSILSNLGVAPTSLCRDKAALPMLLSRSPASLFRFVAFLSSDYVRMPVSKIGPFIRRSECASILDLIAPLPQYNSNLLGGTNDNDGLNLSGDDIGKLLKDGSDYMENEITQRYSAMFDTAGFLRREVGIDDMGKVLAAYPEILTIDKNRVVQIVNYLQEETGMYHCDVARMIESYPMILETDISQMQSIIDYLRSLKVDEDVLGSILRSFPALLTKDPNGSMTEVVDFLKEIGVTNIGRFITRLPPVLGYSVEKDLKPKWRYLASVSQFASFEVGRFPAYFQYPFERVIKSRFEYLRDVKHIPLQLLSVDQILRFGDKDFATIVAKDDDASSYAKYSKQRREKLKRKGKGKGRRERQIKQAVS